MSGWGDCSCKGKGCTLRQTEKGNADEFRKNCARVGTKTAHIWKALEQCCISESTFYRRLREYRLTQKEWELSKGVLFDNIWFLKTKFQSSQKIFKTAKNIRQMLQKRLIFVSYCDKLTYIIIYQKIHFLIKLHGD